MTKLFLFVSLMTSSSLALAEFGSCPSACVDSVRAAALADATYQSRSSQSDCDVHDPIEGNLCEYEVMVECELRSYNYNATAISTLSGSCYVDQLDRAD